MKEEKAYLKLGVYISLKQDTRATTEMHCRAFILLSSPRAHGFLFVLAVIVVVVRCAYFLASAEHVDDTKGKVAGVAFVSAMSGSMDDEGGAVRAL